MVSICTALKKTCSGATGITGTLPPRETWTSSAMSCARKNLLFFLQAFSNRDPEFLSYVWEHLDIGYMQGMCDLVAPLLVILDDEALAYACFCRLMDRMVSNFPNGGAMDTHFANMRLLSKYFSTY
jgi:Rab-GTPase-TBC domain